MNIRTTQKVIKIGSSRGVTLPARDLEALGVNTGDNVMVTIEPIEASRDIADEYEAFVAQYGDTLKRLADR